MRIVALLFFTAINCFSQTEWNLNNCLEYALKHNTEVLRQNEEMKLSDNIYKLSKIDWLPTLSANYYNVKDSYKKYNDELREWENKKPKSGNMELVFEQPLFRGGQNYHTIKQNQFQKQKSRKQLEQVKNDIILSVLQAYTDVLFCKENIDIAMKQYDLLKEQHEHIRMLVEKGMKSDMDLLEMQARLEKEKSQVETAQINYSNKFMELKKNMGYPETQTIRIGDLGYEVLRDFHVPAPDSLYAVALSHLPTPDIIENQIRSDQHNLAAIRSNYYPSVSLTGSISSSFSSDGINPVDPDNDEYLYKQQVRDNRKGNLMLTISVPILSKAQVIQSQCRVNSSIADNRLQESEFKRNLKVEIEKLCSNAKMAKKQHHSLENTFELYNDLFKSRTIQYDRGVITFLDFITAKNNMEAAELELLKSKYNLFYYNQLINFYVGNNKYFNNN